MFVFLNLVCIAALVGIDQAIKLWAVHSLQPVGSMPLIPHVIELRFVYNEGMSFSLLSGKQGFLIAATSIGLLAIAWWLFNEQPTLSMLVGGVLIILASVITSRLKAASPAVVSP